MAMLEDEACLLLQGGSAASGSDLGLLALAASLLLAPGGAPSGHRRSQPPHGIEDQFVDVLEDVEAAQLVVRLGPQFGQHGGVEVRAVGDHDAGHYPPGLEVLQEQRSYRR